MVERSESAFYGGVLGMAVEMDHVHGRAMAASYLIAYGPAAEPWCAQRFFVRNSFGRLVNVVTHL